MDRTTRLAKTTKRLYVCMCVCMHVCVYAFECVCRSISVSSAMPRSQKQWVVKGAASGAEEDDPFQNHFSATWPRHGFFTAPSTLSDPLKSSHSMIRGDRSHNIKSHGSCIAREDVAQYNTCGCMRLSSSMRNPSLWRETSRHSRSAFRATKNTTRTSAEFSPLPVSTQWWVPC